ncbi:unnamed protein product [Clonostachys rhizophaga]|uniref:Zn(2)-C6 fungal-type domain-containing protein n=1 Tax=Clonostachys rhizophaga TaxID=160324 RepID=A0A9N9VSG4_9HYPO|nr:unnamed protein product [Clonostachys rhizophaga]
MDSSPRSEASSICDKSFSRKDVYQRHKRSVHDPDRANRVAGRRKSCRRCIRYKIRCSRELPCTGCRNHPEQCVYGAGAAIPSATKTPVGTINETRGTRRIDEARHGNLNDLVDAANVLNECSINISEIDGTSIEDSDQVSGQQVECNSLTDFPSNVTITTDTTSGCETGSREFFFSRSPVIPQEGILPPPYSVENTLQGPREPTTDAQGALDQLMGDHPETDSHTDQDKSVVDPCIFDFPLDPFQLDLYGWNTLLGGETEAEGPSPGMSVGQVPEDPTTGLASVCGQPMLADDTSPRNYEGEPSNNRPPLGDKSQPEIRRYTQQKDWENKEHWPGVLDQGGNEAWPFDYTSNQGFRRIKLPPLKQILEQTVASRPTIQKNILGDLIKVLSAPQIPSLNDTPALEAMPAVAFLSEYTRVYFAEFHNMFPVIHIPTWRIEKCPTPLLAALACLGATYSTAEGSNEVSTLFAEITQRALFWMGQQDSSAFRNTAYITASCLHQIYALGTGNRRLYEIADASRGLLVTSLRGLGLLSSESSINSTPDSLGLDFWKLKAMSNVQLDEAWRAWRDKETAKRMAWSVFEFDCTLSTMTSKKPAFRIAELPPRLPCSESIWEAHSARAWAALVPFTSSPPAGLLFYPTLREIISQRNVPPDAPAWAMRLCAVAIGSILYDLKEVQDASAPGILGIQAMTEAHLQTRQTLINGLEALDASLGKPMCTADVVNMNVLTLTTHRSHLISSGDETMDLIISIFRNSGLEANHPSARPAEAAKDRLRQIFRSNATNARRLAFHAAVIIAIARDCTINTPCETLSVFMGYAYLLAYIRFATFTEDDIDENLALPRVALDEIPWMRDANAMRQINRWIEYGGPASLGAIANICDRRSFDEAKQGALDALTELSVWGLARKFRQTVSKFV